MFSNHRYAYYLMNTYIYNARKDEYIYQRTVIAGQTLRDLYKALNHEHFKRVSSLKEKGLNMSYEDREVSTCYKESEACSLIPCIEMGIHRLVDSRIMISSPYSSPPGVLHSVTIANKIPSVRPYVLVSWIPAHLRLIARSSKPDVSAPH